VGGRRRKYRRMQVRGKERRRVGRRRVRRRGVRRERVVEVEEGSSRKERESSFGEGGIEDGGWGVVKE